MKLEFRKLKADEIECRIGTIKKDGTGLSLLLYKNARCDMNILDETVGAENWFRDHKELKCRMYCGVGIYNENLGMVVWKWDCGSESNTEAEKGEASDSFKRACVNWGIGRELYTAPFIWVSCDNANIKNFGGKYTCTDKFYVEKITYKENGDIDGLSIINEKNGQRVFVKKPEVKKTGDAVQDAKSILKQHYEGE